MSANRYEHRVCPKLYIHHVVFASFRTTVCSTSTAVTEMSPWGTPPQGTQSRSAARGPTQTAASGREEAGLPHRAQLTAEGLRTAPCVDPAAVLCPGPLPGRATVHYYHHHLLLLLPLYRPGTAAKITAPPPALTSRVAQTPPGSGTAPRFPARPAAHAQWQPPRGREPADSARAQDDRTLTRAQSRPPATSGLLRSRSCERGSSQTCPQNLFFFFFLEKIIYSGWHLDRDHHSFACFPTQIPFLVRCSLTGPGVWFSKLSNRVLEPVSTAGKAAWRSQVAAWHQSQCCWPTGLLGFASVPSGRLALRQLCRLLQLHCTS